MLSCLAARKHSLLRPTQLMEVLSHATEKLSIDWPDKPHKSQSSKLDERFLSSPNSRPERRKLPFFSDLHHEISRSWKQSFSLRLTNAAAAEHQPSGFCEAGLYRHPGGQGHASLLPLAISSAFMEVPPPPSNQTM